MAPSSSDRFFAAGIGAGIAEALTLPIDIAKVRLQTQVPLADGTMKYTGMFQGIYSVAKEEGPVALWKGITPALVRQVSYTGLSFVLYTPIRNTLAGDVPTDEIPFYKRVLSGGLAGSLSIVCMNPTDVVKTQMQTSVGTPKMLDITRKIFTEGGLKGFWRGVEPNIARCFVGNAAEIGCYDQFKTTIIQKELLPDGPIAHFGASGGAGVVSAVFSTPFDVVKTRLMNQAGGGGGEGMVRYTGVIDAFARIPQLEGVGALYKGFWPLAYRKVVWTVCYFMAYERALHAITGEYAQ